MKAICRPDGSFIGKIDNMKTYELVRDGKAAWRPGVGKKLTTVNIPLEVFNYLVHQDKELIKNKAAINNREEIAGLIADMTKNGATAEELMSVVKYSIAVIDAEKSKLDNVIDDLKKKYQNTNVNDISGGDCE